MVGEGHPSWDGTAVASRSETAAWCAIEALLFGFWYWGEGFGV